MQATYQSVTKTVTSTQQAITIFGLEAKPVFATDKGAGSTYITFKDGSILHIKE